MAKYKNILGTGEKISLKNIEYDFVTLASHQLRTPLSAIKWYCEILLSRRPGKLSKKQEQHLQEIYRSNDRAINLVNDLLDVSRIQEGSIHLELRPIHVEKVIEETLDNLGTLITASKIRVNFEIKSGPLPVVEADADKLKRAVTSLLSNALKYTPAGGSIGVSLEKKSDSVLVTISDSGVGIPKAEQGRVFEKFFRSPNVIKLAPDGTGLGLFITKSLVEVMGGKIGFTSQEGQGTTFFFTVPLTA